MRKLRQTGLILTGIGATDTRNRIVRFVVVVVVVVVDELLSKSQQNHSGEAFKSLVICDS